MYAKCTIQSSGVDGMDYRRSRDESFRAIPVTLNPTTKQRMTRGLMKGNPT
ncbi:MAG: hypothetical protein NPIRA02_40270 [Nitrospirales bacterium]|nr:MAG: hypothetical protein NPIRA02_40270 [Nitrospirales bacterium]